MDKKEDFELDLLGFFNYLKKKLNIVALCSLATLLIGLIISLWIIPTKYTASARIYVLNRADESVVAYSDIQLAAQLLNDYKVLITGRNVTQEVIDDLDLKMSTDKLAKMISVTAPDNTRVIQISVTYPENAKRAAEIANAVCDTASKEIERIINQEDSVTTVYNAIEPSKPSSPNVLTNSLLAFFAGLIGSILVFFAIFVLDDTIRNEDEVERYLGLSTLGVIPASVDLGNLTKRKRRRLPFLWKKKK